MSTIRRKINGIECKGGRGIKEVNGKNYCYGRIELGWDDVVYIEECKNCHRLLKNCEEEIDAWIAERREEE